jgi:hypothetical protein
MAISVSLEWLSLTERKGTMSEGEQSTLAQACYYQWLDNVRELEQLVTHHNHRIVTKYLYHYATFDFERQ